MVATIKLKYINEKKKRTSRRNEKLSRNCWRDIVKINQQNDDHFNFVFIFGVPSDGGLKNGSVAISSLFFSLAFACAFARTVLVSIQRIINYGGRENVPLDQSILQTWEL